ncbi:MAG: hypothetical protein PQJ46_13140 [Spirochaetales bacterium]|nr:hypothetical protein [Spirochaetales bacterium]
MEAMIEKLFNETKRKDNKIRLNALNGLLDITEKKVDWFDEVFDDLKNRLKSDNSYQRSIGMMLLCNLSKSDNENHLKIVLPDLLQLLKDEKFITRRQTIQNIWKIAIEKDNLQKKIIEVLLEKFYECLFEEHYNLIRQDIISSLFSIHQKDTDSCPISIINDLIEDEKDVKLQKKYQKILNT